MFTDWLSEQSYVLLNPCIHAKEVKDWEAIVKLSPAFNAHIWLMTSGSTQAKLVALHKNALLASAQAVNHHLQATSNDIWINPLPIFHVGGLSIWARAFLNKASVVSYSEKWSPINFYRLLCEAKGTLTSLVPTQLFDLLSQDLPAPKSLRAVIVGGGALQEPLYLKARELGWPLLPSYGMTECSSQVATASLESLKEKRYPSFEILSHVQVKIADGGLICIQSPALLTAYATNIQGRFDFKYPVTNGWLISQDAGSLSGKFLTFSNRVGDFIKIGGESVDFARLESIFEKIKIQQKILFDVVIAPVPDSRLGYAIHLFTTNENTGYLQTQYNSSVLPFERIRKIHRVTSIPRSSLNKVLKKELIKLISEQ